MTDYKPQDSIRANYPEAVRWRRELHKCPQPSWLEFFATAFVAEKLSGWGYDVKQGRDVIAEDKQLLLPEPAILQAEYDRALKAGAKELFLAPARGGFTGVVATLEGDLPGLTARLEALAGCAPAPSPPAPRPPRSSPTSRARPRWCWWTRRAAASARCAASLSHW